MKRFSVEVVRCDSGSKLLIDSSVSPKKSSLTGASEPGGKMSTMPPRTAKSPGSTTVPVREKPFSAK